MIALRAVQEKDSIFIEKVYRSSREAELAATSWTEEQKHAFIVMQSMAQLHDYRRKFPNALYQIILYGKKNVGRLYTCESADDIRLLDITILPAWQGKKIGTYLLQQLIALATKKKKKLSLHVHCDNPAVMLYKKLGFATVTRAGAYWYMEHKPV